METESFVKLFFIRHGLSCSQYGRGKKKNWHLQDPFLSDIGIEALKNYQNVIVENGIKPDYVFSSNLLRAMQTAQILFPDKMVNISPYIGEMSPHGLENVPTAPSRQLKYLKGDKVRYLYLEGIDDLDELFNNRDEDIDKPDFEKFLKWLTPKLQLSLENKDLTIAVVGHSNFMQKMLISYKMLTVEEDFEKDKKRWPWNAAVVEITLVKRPGKSLKPYNTMCKELTTLTEKNEYDTPCYGIKLLGIKDNSKEDNINSENCEEDIDKSKKE